MRRDVGLNLGCGDHADLGDENWINVDRHNLPQWEQPPDVVANALTGLPFPAGRFSALYLGHILEHLLYDDEIDLLWQEMRRVCRPGTAVRVVGPCLHKAQALGEDPKWIAQWARDEGPSEGLHHRWVPTTEATLSAVQRLDPKAEEIAIWQVRPPAWPNPTTAGWQVAIKATVP